LFSLLPATAPAGTRVELGEDRDMNLYFLVQFWNPITFDAVGPEGQELGTRSDLYLRRARLGVQGNFRSDIRYVFNFAYDNVGKDIVSGSTGKAQSQENQEFHIWDAFCTLKLHPELFHLTLGYFRPQVGRESITTGFKVNSFPKALTNSYPREHILGRGPGRETGINLGGLYQSCCWGLNYNFGLFDPNHERIVGTAGGGVRWAPLWAGRVAMTIGDPEMGSYGLTYDTNFFGQREGITLAINGTYQGRTNQTYDPENFPEQPYRGGFEKNTLAGIDLLANYDNLNLTAEYDILTRHFTPLFAAESAGLTCNEFTDRVWFIRVGYNLTLPGEDFLEPAVMFTRFAGDRNSAFYPAGVHELVDVGLNWYLDRHRWKINLHYIWQHGEPTSKFSSGEDALGDFLGLGFQLVY
jgi:hypothetical protein